MTPRKRQLKEAQDTGQSNTEAKISKMDVQNVQASVVADSEDLQEKKIQMEEEKPKGKNILKRLPCEMICRIFRYLPDKDLFNHMLSDRFFEKSAGYVLQRRKLYLSTLYISFYLKRAVVLTVETSHTMSASTHHQEYDLKVENAAALCRGYEEQKGNRLTRAIHLLISYYNCSSLVLTGGAYTDEIPLTFEAFFKAAPTEPSEKIKIDRLVMTSHTGVLLRWFCPTILDVFGSPNLLIQASQKELKELIVGIGRIRFPYGSHGVLVEKVMKVCEAKDIFIYNDYNWSDESILSAVKANANCDNTGATRTIKMYRSDRSCAQWKEIFASIMESCIENHGFFFDRLTIKMPKCSFELHLGKVKLILY